MSDALALKVLRLEHLAQTDMDAFGRPDAWELGKDFLEDFVYQQRTYSLAILRTAETGVNHPLKTYNSLIPLIELLDAPDLFAGEPVPHLLLMEFLGHLGVELLIVDDCLIVDELPLGNADAEIASGTCRIVQRTWVVGGAYE